MSAQVIKFGTNLRFLEDSSVSVEVHPPSTDIELIAALAADTPFPERRIKLGSISARASGGQGIKFAGSRGTVKFQADGGAMAGLGVYASTDDLIEDLQIGDDDSPKLNIPLAPDRILLALRCGYDLRASAQGSVALGAVPGTVKFGANVKREAMYAVVRSLKKMTGARTAMEKTVGSWILPSHVSGAADLEPGTWIITEVDGTFGANLGVQFGYDFNWVREARLGELVGDIGLHIELAASAALGFQATGKFALVLSRESIDAGEALARLQLFKLRKRGWNFALNASAEIQADFGEFVKSDFEGFIKAVLGIHGQQIVKYLQAFEKWTDPEAPLPELLADLAVDSAFELLERVTGIKPAKEFERARQTLLGLLKKWNDLDHQVATVLWKLIEERVDLAPVREMLGKIATGNQETVKQFLAPLLARVDLFATPTGRLLTASASKGILAPLVNTEEFKRFQAIARKANEILDGSVLEDALTRLQQFIDEKLSLKAIEEIVTELDFRRLDAWLKARLTAFLGEAVDFAKVEAIRKTIHLLLEKRNEFFDRTKEALNREFGFSIAINYQSATTRTALFDIVFDLRDTQAVVALQEAVGGKFEDILVRPQTGVSLNTAVLTHQIQRQSHINIDMPFYESKVDHINTALARVNAVGEDDGRVLVFELEAEDIVESRNNRLSRLSVAGSFPVRLGNQVRVHSTAGLGGSYAFRQVRLDMKRAELEFQLKPYVDRYFPSAFGGQEDPGAKGTFLNFIGEMDKTIDLVESNGTDVFGNTLISIELAFSEDLAAAWLKAPAEKKAPVYMDMSRRLQSKLRQLIPFYFFQEVEKYKDLKSAMALMVYAALPVSTSVRSTGSGRLTLNTNDDVYWNWPDDDLRRAMVLHAITSQNLSSEMAQVESLLQQLPGLRQSAGFYAPDQMSRVLNTALKGHGAENLNRLLFVEAEVVGGAVKAGTSLGKFMQQSEVNPTEAVKALADFGENITRTFNERIRSLYGGSAVRPLGSLALLEAARALDPALAIDEPLAILEIIALKQESTFALSGYLKGKLPPKEDIVIAERLINID